MKQKARKSSPRRTGTKKQRKRRRERRKAEKRQQNPFSCAREKIIFILIAKKYPLTTRKKWKCLYDDSFGQVIEICSGSNSGVFSFFAVIILGVRMTNKGRLCLTQHEHNFLYVYLYKYGMHSKKTTSAGFYCRNFQVRVILPVFFFSKCRCCSLIFL